MEANAKQESALQSLQEGEARLNLATHAANIGIWGPARLPLRFTPSGATRA